MKELVNEYVKTFGRNLPVYMIPRGSDYEGIIKDCLRRGKPYESKENAEGRLY